MNENVYNYIFRRLKNDLFLDIVILILSLILTYFLVKKFKRNINHILFIAYSLSYTYLFSVGSDISLSIIYKEDIIKKKAMLESGNIALSLIEALTFYFFFKKITTNRITIKLLKILGILFLIYFIYCLILIYISPNHLRTLYTLSFKINSLEFFFLFIICLSYYYSKISINQIKQAIGLNELLIVNSLFLYISISLPFLSLGTNMKSLPNWTYKSIVILHYLSIINVIATLLVSLKNQKEIIK